MSKQIDTSRLLEMLEENPQDFYGIAKNLGITTDKAREIAITLLGQQAMDNLSEGSSFPFGSTLDPQSLPKGNERGGRVNKMGKPRKITKS